MQLADHRKLNSIHRYLTRKGETIAVAESVTSGLLQAALGQSEKASEFYQGGITVYNLGQKHKHLQVEPIHAELHNCVSEKITAEMAQHVCALFNSQWGIGITGYATPVPESGHKLFAFYAIAHHSKIAAKGKLVPGSKDPFTIQLFYVKRIIDTLLEKLR
jgi:PncC family amidohydrolase